MKYIQIKSLTWWTGVFSIVLSILMMSGWHYNELSHIGIILSTLNGVGNSSPAGLFLFGLGLIGVRSKLERM